MTLNRTILKIPKMDCGAEEQMVRAALAHAHTLRNLNIDLESNQATLFHVGPAGPLLALVEPLGLGARITLTEESAVEPNPAESDQAERRTLWTVLAINAAMFIFEMAAGWLGGSSGLMADSLDMLADTMVYGLSLAAVAGAVAGQRRAAKLSGIFQMVLALAVLSDTLRRFVYGADPDGQIMAGVSGLALVANSLCLWLLRRHKHAGIHMQASIIFTNSDVLANLGVIVAGLLVALSDSKWPDLVIGALISMLVFRGAIRILRLSAISTQPVARETGK